MPRRGNFPLTLRACIYQGLEAARCIEWTPLVYHQIPMLLANESVQVNADRRKSFPLSDLAVAAESGPIHPHSVTAPCGKRHGEIQARMSKFARKEYRFGDFVGSSKTAAAKFFSELRQRYEDGETISDAADYRAIWDLLQEHCQRDQKIGAGVRRFYVARAPDHPTTRCFWIERIEGKPTEFGFAACVDRIRRLNLIDLRKLVQPQIYAFRDKALVGSGEFITCAITSEPLRTVEAEVDHVIPFEEIVVRFAECEGINLETELLTVSCDGRSTPTWRDDALAARFLEFHLPFPLRLTSKDANLRRKRKGGRSAKL